MNCVLDALHDYLDYFGRKSTVDSAVYWWVTASYNAIKHVTHDGNIDVPTHGCVVPYIVRYMAKTMDLGVEAQHCLHTPKMYLNSAETSAQVAIIKYEDFGEYADPLALEPAIYLLNADNHAVFAETVPDYGVPVMALQLRKERP
jgi:hypothetical protein